MNVQHVRPRLPLRVEVWTAFGLGVMVGVVGASVWIAWGPWWSVR